VRFEEEGSVDRLYVGDAEYDRAGQLRLRRLRAIERIDDVLCAPGLALFREGRLSRATLAEPLATPFGDLPAGTNVEFALDGSVRGGIVEERCVLGSVTFEPRDPFRIISSRPVRDGWTFHVPWKGPRGA
jgi:hypothetical protein